MGKEVGVAIKGEIGEEKLWKAVCGPGFFDDNGARYFIGYESDGPHRGTYGIFVEVEENLSLVVGCGRYKKMQEAEQKLRELSVEKGLIPESDFYNFLDNKKNYPLLLEVYKMATEKCK